jgi:hypothetical protein
VLNLKLLFRHTLVQHMWLGGVLQGAASAHLAVLPAAVPACYCPCHLTDTGQLNAFCVVTEELRHVRHF